MSADSLRGVAGETISRGGAVGRATVWSRARTVYRRAGLRGLWFGVLGATVYRRLLLLDRTLERDVARAGDEPVAEVVVLQDEKAYRRFRPEAPAGEFARRTGRGAICHAAILGGRVVGATWAEPGGGRASYLGRDVPCASDEVYLSDTYVLPELRGRRIAPAIAAEQIRYFRAAGYRRIVVTVLPENRASLRARRRTGFEVYGVMGCLGVGRLRWEFERRLPRRRPA